MRLADMSWDEAEAYLRKNDRVILPLGATEQHGRMGPLGTDHLIPQSLADALSQATGAVCAPCLPFGVSEHHMAFPGTVSIGPRPYMAFVGDVVESLYRHGFRRVFVINGHGGNVAPLTCALQDLCNAHLDLRVRIYQWWTLPGVEDLERELFGSETICHASPGEVSLAQHARPEARKAKKVPPGIAEPWGEDFMNRERERATFPDGVLGSGDQNRADPAKGKTMFDRILGLLRERFDSF
jgi:creatinine amidohydrolase